MADITEEKKDSRYGVLCFEVGDKILGIDSRAAVEISPTTDTAKIPGSCAYIEGVFIKRERIVTVIDMHCLLDTTCPADKRGMLVICHLDSPDTDIGLHVSNVLNFVEGEKTADSVISTAFGDIPAATVASDSVTAKVIDLKSVLNLCAG